MSSQSPKGFLAQLNPFALASGLWARRDIVWQFTIRNFHARHKGSMLGIAWAVLNPLLMLGLYFTVFRLIFRGHFGVLPDETSGDFALALLLGLSVFHFIADVIGLSPSVIIGQPSLVKKVVFPVEVLPVANLGACCFGFAISFCLVLLGVVFFGRGLPLTSLWAPVILVPMVLMAAGVSWMLAALGVFLRDVSQVTQFLSLLLMYVSGIFYSSVGVAHSAPKVWAVLRFNPVLQTIDMLRGAMLWHQPVSLVHLGCLYAASLVFCLAGYACFAVLRPTFADVL